MQEKNKNQNLAFSHTHMNATAGRIHSLTPGPTGRLEPTNLLLESSKREVLPSHVTGRAKARKIVFLAPCIQVGPLEEFSSRTSAIMVTLSGWPTKLSFTWKSAFHLTEINLRWPGRPPSFKPPFKLEN